MASDKKLTPMMQQFYDFKKKYPDALLLFRCGDFYETYADDAIIAAKILGITLTHRNNGGPKGNPDGEKRTSDAMAGFPYHALDTYLPRLIRAGKRVAICDQLEDPKKTKTLVKRGVTEVVTPGVAMQDNVLQNKENNFLCAVHMGKGNVGVAFLDISTGEFMCGEGSYEYVQKLIDSFQPKEVVFNRVCRNDFTAHFPGRMFTSEMEDWVFTQQSAESKLHKHFKVRTLKGYGVDFMKNGIIAAGAIMYYLEQTQHTQLQHITSLQRIDVDKYVRLDGFTIRSLELISTMASDGVSLLDVIDNTSTAMGGRMLRRWITFPLKDERQICERLDTVDYFFRNPEFRVFVDEQLHRIADLERIITKISTGRVGPREMRSLMEALSAVAQLKYACAHTDMGSLLKIADRLEPCKEMAQRIAREIVIDPPLLAAKGGFIATGVNAELDDLREIHTNGKAYLLDIQRREAERTGISSLKIGYNNVFGYYLEVRNTYKDNVPPQWIRKQTLAQAERYITDELKQYEEKILGAEEKILIIENQIFEQLINDCRQLIPQIQQDASIIARLDCLLSFAIISEQNHYIRPVIDQTLDLDIRQGRHPVIESQLPLGEQYVPNDIRIAPQAPQVGGCIKNASITDNNGQNILNDPPLGGTGGLGGIFIITGPNMAGKSALLRQTALIVLLAQIGCFVPAESARIGIVDRIFTRVGASDNIAQGESTFMVEMTEASNILNNITERSLVLFDELGRGTSTYDGISIAWSIVEYLATGKKPRTLFATHYHELNEMANHFPVIRNYNVSVMQKDGKVIFLRKLEEGGSEHSFGIHVAEMAGMPRQIVKRANEVLAKLEQQSQSPDAKTNRVDVSAIKDAANTNGTELNFFQLDDPILTQIRDELIGLDVNNLTPIEALNKLNQLKKIIG